MIFFKKKKESNKKQTKPQKTVVPERYLTAEGWQRMQLKAKKN